MSGSLKEETLRACVLLEGVWTSWAEPRGWFSTEGCVEMCLARGLCEVNRGITTIWRLGGRSRKDERLDAGAGWITEAWSKRTNHVGTRQVAEIKRLRKSRAMETAVHHSLP